MLTITENKFITKEDYLEALETLIRPLRSEILQSTKPGISLGTSGAVYSPQRAETEALIRPLWGLAPLWTVKKDTPLQQSYLDKIIEGTDPEHPLYWGNMQNYDQYIVETAALSLTLLLHQESFWKPLPKKAKQNLVCWLHGALTKKIPKNNWTFFKVLIRISLFSCGEELDNFALQEELKLIDSMYIGDGWYVDGKETQKDYYIPFAFHYYGLIYATVMKEVDPERSQVFTQRATLFAKDFLYYFDEDGEALPFGRSGTYRFAQAAFFSALVFADVEALPWGQIKTLLSQHLKTWMNHDIFTFDGRLSIGYHYENLVMAEGYNAPGSPYWSLKTFLLLAVPDSHPFWQAPLLPVKRQAKKHIRKGNMLCLYNQNRTHLVGYPAGLMIEGQAHAAAKYNKFVYSTKFGYSVPKANATYEEGAFDNTLAVSCEDGYYRSKSTVTNFSITETCLTHEWSPFEGVVIKTELYPFGEWHLRLHEIETNRTLTLQEGGFSVPFFTQQPQGMLEKDYCTLQEGELLSQIVAIEGYDQAAIIRPEVNTSLFFPRTVYPALQKKLTPGKHRLLALVGGVSTPKKG